ncbi:MAG: dephospho-CoA kinase [Armatimonadia bacterium]
MLVIGIVGAIGAGKTEVLRLFGELGARTVAADELSREVLAPGAPALKQVREAFGDEYFDEQGHLRRRALGNLIFKDEAARRRLDDLVHPLMTERLRERLAQWRAEGAAVAAVESAVLVEMGARPLVDKVVLVRAGKEERLGRLAERDHLDEQETRRRLAAHERLALGEAPADFTINNDGDLGELRRQVEHVWRRLVCSS